MAAALRQNVIEDAVCPACGGKGMTYHATQVDLPYLGDSLETMIRCERCGYRHSDFVLVETNDPMRVSYTVSTADDMSVRVVRSSSGTVRIPELGIAIEPGVASEAFVSNIEGILVRVERVLDQLHRDTEDATHRARIEELQATMQAMRDGKAEPVTVVIEDPYGNSTILSELAVQQRIPHEEAEKLKTGMMVFDPTGRLVDPDDPPHNGEEE